jgi:hypothetical protein
MTFFKEGMATLGEYLFHARQARAQAGGPGTAAGRKAFQHTLVKIFDQNYHSTGEIWTSAPAFPTPATLFDGGTTYTRPGTAYVAVRQILGHRRFVKALRYIQRTYTVIDEHQLEFAFEKFLPHPTGNCQSQLHSFFTQWFDTSYPPGQKPSFTGPGLAGGGFSC